METMKGDDDKKVVNPTANEGLKVLEMSHVVERILSYLPVPDLLACTLLNKTWEKEARKQLLQLVVLNFTESGLGNKDFATHVTSYTKDMAPRGRYHAKLRIGEIKSAHENNIIRFLMNRMRNNTWPSSFAEKWTDHYMHIIGEGIKPTNPARDTWFNSIFTESPTEGYTHEQRAFGSVVNLIASQVKEVSMIWPSPEDAQYYFEILSKFCNLVKLELTVRVPMDRTDFEDDEHFTSDDPRQSSLKTRVLPQGTVLPSVKKLVVKFDSCDGEMVMYTIQDRLKKGLARSILELCPNVEFLHVEDYYKEFGVEIGKHPTRFTKITQVKFDPANFSLTDDCQEGILALQHCPLRVIHLEFGMGAGLDGFQEILNKFANSLEVLEIDISMANWDTIEQQPGLGQLKTSTILVPKMPKLKKISVKIGMIIITTDIMGDQCDRRAPCRPAHDFAFVTATGTQKIDYDLQFPALTSLAIKIGQPLHSGGPSPPTALFDLFTPQSDPPCSTVRILDIDYPAEDKEFLDRNAGIGAMISQNCTRGWQKLSQM